MSCCSNNKLSTRNDDTNSLYEILKIDSTKSMYLIQIRNGKINELVLSERNCKAKSKNKIVVGKEYPLRIDPLDSYFNDDDFEKNGFKVDDINVKSLTQGTIYMSNNLCGLYISEK
ncbi:hypothetical protein EB354_05240 [Chryseobacterium balustinum]|uniref:Uncharacterized protein n=2 Tax=Chryseobacterium balustinum TaxID=246 RepID=A0AAQ1MZY1_9FLAO|nr:hypothetical protein [Chryseobacterium balustinum]AZB28703.1 hypothetical protein EB354_05190 [Chryseobacterium balustinum]AZB28711.1 hypothetical protein EB354_05240 [Chryseobacterium balustinum]SKC07146.1 hypothetical protein SAMN05421800_12643 [Chryseobacterium balustinum]SKC07218.1 hypothetical protein SAMN05421800_12652 [Chryseobacterium balustinum]SQA91839.1 Uncharacterised protein [Chryseobacterium balustinum]